MANEKITDDLNDVVRNTGRSQVKVNLHELNEPSYMQHGIEPQIAMEDNKFVYRKPPIQYAQASQRFNPMAQTYSSIDGKSLDTSQDDFHGHYIDNNEFIFPDDPFNMPKQKMKPLSDTPDIGDYILMVFGKLVCFGHHSVIEDRIEAILYGTDKGFVGKNPTSNDIVVLKRVEVKVGVSIK
jgi:hypothetical protein